MSNRQITDEAAEWFVTLRYDGHDSDVHDRFMAWLRTSPEHVRAYLAVGEVWNDLPAVAPQNTLDAQKLVAQAAAEADVLPLQGARRSQASSATDCTEPGVRRSVLYRAAAAATLLLVVGLIMAVQMYYAGLYSTGVGEQRSFHLADGSRVQLNSRSRLRVKFSEKERAIELLSGQAMFQVEKDRHRPFVVRAGTAQVRAVGTQFDVYRRGDATTVTVVEGRVAVSGKKVQLENAAAGSSAVVTSDESPRDGPREVVVSAGERLIVAQAVTPQPESADVAAATSWIRGQLIFKSTPLSVVVEEFNRYNRRHIVLDQTVDDFPVTAVFSSSDPRMLVEFLKVQPGLAVQVGDDEIRVAPAR